jgi:thermostable 8-oxoguanine DNA glycosylase
MKTHTLLKTLTLCVALTGLSATMAQEASKTQDQDQLKTQNKDPLREQDRIYRDDLMTAQERSAYLERLRLAKTEQERERIRQEHREKMDLRLRALNQHKAAPSGSGMGKNMGGNGPIILPKQGGGGRN